MREVSVLEARAAPGVALREGLGSRGGHLAAQPAGTSGLDV